MGMRACGENAMRMWRECRREREIATPWVRERRRGGSESERERGGQEEQEGEIERGRRGGPGASHGEERRERRSDREEREEWVTWRTRRLRIWREWAIDAGALHRFFPRHTRQPGWRRRFARRMHRGESGHCGGESEGREREGERGSGAPTARSGAIGSRCECHVANVARPPFDRRPWEVAGLTERRGEREARERERERERREGRGGEREEERQRGEGRVGHVPNKAAEDLTRLP